MSNSSDIFGGGGGKPKLITKITSGTGTYIPTADGARCRIMRQGSGGGGAWKSLTNANAGGAGAMVESFELVPIAGITYSVGAAGVGRTGSGGAGGNGNPTRCGNMSAPPGLGGANSNSALVATDGRGGALINGDVTNGIFGLLQGVAGGASGADFSSQGYAAGFPIVGYTGNGQVAGGGDSYFGKGGLTGVGASVAGGATTGYGAGGGAGNGAAGSAGGSGYIEIWDFGA